MNIDKIIEREFADPLITHDNNKAKIYQQDQLRALLQEAVDGAMGKVGCPSCGDSCEHEWVLISPENLRFTGKSAFEVVRKEMNSRIPPAKQLENIIKANEAAEFDYQADVAMAVAKAVEAERKDAERYRFVRAEHDSMGPLCRVSWKMFGQRNSTNWANVIDSKHLDAEIDAAIAAEEGEMINATQGRNKGQWWPTRDSDGNQSATYYCQQCGKPCGLQQHSISEIGEVSPSVICPHASQVECPSCNFHDYLRLEGWLDYWINRSWCASLENWWNQASEEEKKLAYKSAINSDCWKKERISFLELQIAAAEGK